MADASLGVLRYYKDLNESTNSTSPSCLVTRDFFDLFVEHLSSTSNQLPMHNLDIANQYYQRLIHTTQLLSDKTFYRHEVDPRLNQTLAIMIFSSVAYSVAIQTQQQSDIRLHFFMASFFSVFRYFKFVVVYVNNEEQKQLLLSNAPNETLPVWEILILDVPLDAKNRPQCLVRESLLQVIHRLQNPTLFPLMSSFKYIYFSESDLILHMRHTNEIYNLIDINPNWNVIVPHRMNVSNRAILHFVTNNISSWQTLPITVDLPASMHNSFSSKSSFRIEGATILTENVYDAAGSCCESGRYEIAPCKGWWYNCPYWGLKQMRTWFKFGGSGFTFPSVSEHKAKCVYDSQKRLCALPTNCQVRTPSKEVPTYCGPHYDHISFLGPANVTENLVDELPRNKGHRRSAIRASTHDGINIDRYVTIKKPYKQKRNRSKRRGNFENKA